MVQSFDDDFRVTWRDPSDALLYWRMEKIHYPYPLAPLGQAMFDAYIRVVFAGRVVFVNGYAFMYDYKLVPPTQEVIEQGAVPIWRNEFLPRIKQTVADVRHADYDAMTAVEIVRSLPELFDRLSRHMFDTVTVVPVFIQPAVDLTAFCEREAGAEGPALAVALLGGFRNESTSATAGLERLADFAARRPEVAAAIQEGRFAGLGRVEGGAEFNQRLKPFLDDYGWRAESWCLFHVPTWAEDPSTPLKLIARYLAEPDRSPQLASARAVSRREDAAREIESGLGAEKLAEFRQLRPAAELHVEISEERELWQLLLMGCLRMPVLALGRKLVAADVIDEPNDVFYLYFDELAGLVSDPGPRQELVGERKGQLARWEKLSPPDYIGTRGATPPDPAAADFFRYYVGAGAAGIEGRVIRGVGASKGVVRARARVILELNDADRMQPGEVLVTRTTSAPWTPLFAIAGAVVTDTGGLLSHSAICAREYAIPCVTGTRVATTRIPDGATITVDGEKGTVTIEG